MAQFAENLPSDGYILGRILNALHWDFVVPSDWLSVTVEKDPMRVDGGRTG